MTCLIISGVLLVSLSAMASLSAMTCLVISKNNESNHINVVFPLGRASPATNRLESTTNNNSGGTYFEYFSYLVPGYFQT